MQVSGKGRSRWLVPQTEESLVQKPVGKSLAPSENQKFITIEGDVAMSKPEEQIVQSLGKSFLRTSVFTPTLTEIF